MKAKKADFSCLVSHETSPSVSHCSGYSSKCIMLDFLHVAKHQDGPCSTVSKKKKENPSHAQPVSVCAKHRSSSVPRPISGGRLVWVGSLQSRWVVAVQVHLLKQVSRQCHITHFDCNVQNLVPQRSVTAMSAFVPRSDHWSRRSNLACGTTTLTPVH